MEIKQIKTENPSEHWGFLECDTPLLIGITRKPLRGLALCRERGRPLLPCRCIDEG